MNPLSKNQPMYFFTSHRNVKLKTKWKKKKKLYHVQQNEVWCASNEINTAGPQFMDITMPRCPGMWTKKHLIAPRGFSVFNFFFLCLFSLFVRSFPLLLISLFAAFFISFRSTTRTCAVSSARLQSRLIKRSIEGSRLPSFFIRYTTNTLAINRSLSVFQRELFYSMHHYTDATIPFTILVHPNSRISRIFHTLLSILTRIWSKWTK